MKLKVKDNEAKVTLLYIHGYNSNGDSVKNILNKDLNFNVVYFDYPNDRLYNAQEIAKEADEIVDRIKGQVVVMGHSLGGAVMTHMKDRFKIKKYIFMSSLSPIVLENKGMQFLAKQNNNGSKLKNILAKSLNYVGQDRFAAFVKPTKKWMRFANENILNVEYLSKDLLDGYKSKANKSISIIGTKDLLFDYLKYNEFMYNLNINSYTIQNSGHSTINDSPNEVVAILNNEIEYKKRKQNKILKDA